MRYVAVFEFDGTLAELAAKFPKDVKNISVSFETDILIPKRNYLTMKNSGVSSPPPDDATVGKGNRLRLTPSGIEWLEEQFAMREDGPTIRSIAKLLGTSTLTISQRRCAWLRANPNP